MGLDNFFKRSKNSPKNVKFPEGLHLFGGMFSGHGSDGSFRGKVYDEFFSANTSVSLYQDIPPGGVALVASELARLLEAHPNEGWDAERGWVPDDPTLMLKQGGVTAQEVRDLAALFASAAEQKMKLVAWY
jgi:hypothetical protein